MSADRSNCQGLDQDMAENAREMARVVNSVKLKGRPQAGSTVDEVLH